MQLALLASRSEDSPLYPEFWTQLDANSGRVADFGRGFSSGGDTSPGAVVSLQSDGKLMLRLARISFLTRRAETNKGDLWPMTS
jgi:hypothetical protein